MGIEELEKKLEKISLGCEKCKAKICGICPNGQIKKTIKNIKSIFKKREGFKKKGKRFFHKNKKEVI